MTTSSIKGKALLAVEKLEDSKYGWSRFDVSTNVLTGEENGCVAESFSYCWCETLPLPDVTKKMKVGDKFWIKVVYEIFFHTDYWGEHDVELTYHKEKVIKKRSAQ